MAVRNNSVSSANWRLKGGSIAPNAAVFIFSHTQLVLLNSRTHLSKGPVQRVSLLKTDVWPSKGAIWMVVRAHPRGFLVSHKERTTGEDLPSGEAGTTFAKMGMRPGPQARKTVRVHMGRTLHGFNALVLELRDWVDYSENQMGLFDSTVNKLLLPEQGALDADEDPVTHVNWRA